MFYRVLILVLMLFFVAGCYEDSPPPMIVYTPDNSIENLIKSVPSYPQIQTSTPSSGWAPYSSVENRQKWHGIVIHHSATPYGCAAHEHEYHQSIGWDGLGYHFVVNNGVYSKGYGKPDGLVEVGYRWQKQLTGSHCRVNGDPSNYWNEHTIGICLIGNLEESRPTQKQMNSLAKLIRFLQARYNIPSSKIKGHSDIKATKCPGRNFSFAELRRYLASG